MLRIVGYARRDLKNTGFCKHVAQILTEHKGTNTTNKQKFKSFLELLIYHQGQFEDLSAYKTLAKKLTQADQDWGVCSNKLFYVAAPPPHYQTIFQNIADSGLAKGCGPGEGWTKILVEKPFGKDLKEAEKLDNLLGQLFNEQQIYRIDHYLGKEMLQNILTFRFSNNLLEQSWNNRFIEKIEIKLWETGGVETRGAFYDSMGALRDVGQNHLLQMLALVTMDNPQTFSPETIRSARARVLEKLRPLNKAEIAEHTFRAQYKGYKQIEGVKKDSSTETYFKIRAFIDSPRWRGIPIFLESGKKMKEQRKEIIVTFRHPMPCLCPSDKPHLKNKIIFRLEPTEGIIIQFWAKKPGFDLKMRKSQFSFQYRKIQQGRVQYTEEYEKLLLDSIKGDQTLFVSTEEVRAMWRFIDPIISAWQGNTIPLKVYQPSTTPDSKITTSFKQTPGTVLKTKCIGIIGLGKMGGNLALQLIERGWTVYGYNRTKSKTQYYARLGLLPTYSIQELVNKLPKPRIIWLMLPAGKVIDNFLFGKNGIVQYIEEGDFVIDGGNSFYKNSIKRGIKLGKHGVHFVDVGVSGGPSGARNGASLMIGGKRENFEYLLPLLVDIAAPEGCQFFQGAGAGHFVKMIHNGIEYGMMQAIGEGFNLMKHATYQLNLKDVAHVYNHGSVIESRLIGWLEQAFELYGDDLKNVTGIVAHSGEGKWTVQTAKEMKIKAKVIEEALKFRIQSEKNPQFTGQVISALRGQFGGHDVTIKEKD